MALTNEEKERIELIVIKAIDAFKDKAWAERDKILVSAIQHHEDRCSTRIQFDRLKWLFIGVFGSGVVGGGTLGAWIVSALKTGVTAGWMQDIVRYFIT